MWLTSLRPHAHENPVTAETQKLNPKLMIHHWFNYIIIIAEIPYRERWDLESARDIHTPHINIWIKASAQKSVSFSRWWVHHPDWAAGRAGGQWPSGCSRADSAKRFGRRSTPPAHGSPPPWTGQGCWWWRAAAAGSWRRRSRKSWSRSPSLGSRSLGLCSPRSESGPGRGWTLGWAWAQLVQLYIKEIFINNLQILIKWYTCTFNYLFYIFYCR